MREGDGDLAPIEDGVDPGEADDLDGKRTSERKHVQAARDSLARCLHHLLSADPLNGRV